MAHIASTGRFRKPPREEAARGALSLSGYGDAAGVAALATLGLSDPDQRAGAVDVADLQISRD